MKQNEKQLQPFYLNTSGLLIYKHKTHPNMFLHRQFAHVDRISLLHESFEGRCCIDDFCFSTFNTDAWRLITIAENNLVKAHYNELWKTK
ncbi:MAG: hypothetical protein QM489_00480 [Candidatus Izemoplasma sp.]